MKGTKVLSVLLTLVMLCGMIPAMAFGTVSAATLTNSYEASTWYEIGAETHVDAYRDAGYLVRYTPDFDFQVDCAQEYGWYEAYRNFYAATGKGYTCTNQWGIDIAVNRYGYVVDVSEKGNIKIPEDGFVLSAVNKDEEDRDGGWYDTIGTYLKNNVKIGDYIRIEGNITDGYKYYGCRVTDDSKLTHTSMAFALPYPILSGTYTKYSQWSNFTNLSDTDRKNTADTAYNAIVTDGGAGQVTDDNDWNTHVIIKKTGTNGDSKHPIGYVVSVGGDALDVPDGYMALTLSGQTGHDSGLPAYNASMLFRDVLVPGTLVNFGSFEVFARHDVAAAQRAAALLTGLTEVNGQVTDTYEYSATTIINDAYERFELVDIDRMQALYDNMCEIAVAVQSMTTFAEIEPYMATLNQNYAELCKLEFERRPVEMRAAWMRPLPNDRVERSAEELDALLTENILEIKDMGYNMIFVEAFYNSCTVFPVPSTAGYNGLYFAQNPYLVPTTMTCGSSGQPGLNSKLTEPYDMLQRFIDICKDNEVEPHIWWEVFYVGYQRTNDMTDSLFEYSVAQQILNNQTKYSCYLNQAHTGSYYYGAETDSAHQYFLNPGSTGARTFLMNTFEYIWANYDVESFQLDYIRYPHTDEKKCFGYDADTLAAFHAAYPNNTTDLYTYDGFFDTDWVNFRANYVTTFVEQIRTRMKEINSGIYLTASPGPDPAESKKNLMQDVSYWLTNDLIDIIFPMAYGENVPGDVSAGLVADNSAHFVCTGVSGSYKDAGMEQRWMKEVRDAGTDGLAAFGHIDTYKDYVWENHAITPTGNAAKAARTYLEEVVKARVARMVKLRAIDASKQETINAAVAAADKAIRLYGIDSSQALNAINALNSQGLSGNAKTAMEKDVSYLLKIRNNSRDIAKEDFDLSVDDSNVSQNSTLTVGNVNIANDADTAFVYTASTNTLLVNQTARFWPVLSGELVAPVTVVTGDGVTKLELKNVNLTADSTALIENSGITIELTGTNVINGNLGATSFFGTGSLYNGDTLVRMQGDVDDDQTMDTTDVGILLRYNVKAITFTEKQIGLSDANGDGLINTMDTRMFLKAAITA